MEKDKLNSAVTPIVVSLICVVLAMYAITSSAELNAEKARSVALNVEMINIGIQIADVKARYDEQVRVNGDLRSSLDATRRDLDVARRDLDVARTEMETLKASMPAPETPTVPAE
ncbi:MAG: hypothetical protein KJ706_06975 [Candidatus Omnitrophica bacterium]|nr:hypothetical protein [Candidatus Omnitrophota bacterium]MBU4590261.1 hypothetical protein [Candidatus Omnitrophota bacterium]